MFILKWITLVRQLHCIFSMIVLLLFVNFSDLSYKNICSASVSLLSSICELNLYWKTEDERIAVAVLFYFLWKREKLKKMSVQESGSICFLGWPSEGAKTSIIEKYFQLRHNKGIRGITQIPPTHETHTTLGGSKYIVKIVDCDDVYNSHTARAVRECWTFMIGYDLTSYDSFVTTKEFVAQVCKLKEIRYPSSLQLIFVGNKLDVCLSNPSARKVPKEEAEVLCRLLGASNVEV